MEGYFIALSIIVSYGKEKKKSLLSQTLYLRLKEHTRETFLYIFNSILNKNRNRPKNNPYLNY